MGLTSGSLIAAIAAATTLFGCFTVFWLWPRLAAQSIPAMLGRLGALAVTQAMVLMLVLTAVNAHFGFFTSWADLLGTTDTTNTAAPAGTIGSGDAPKTTPGHADESTLQVLSGAKPESAAARSGELLTVRIDGSLSGLTSGAQIYLPKQYFQPAYAHRRIPGVEVFPGYPGSVPSLVKSVGIPGLFQRQADAGRAQPMAAVMIRETVDPPWDTECANVYRGPAVETYLTQDVTAAVSAHFRVGGPHRDWATWGYSTGGFCAVKFAIRHPSLYRSAVSLSGYYYALEDLTTGDLYGGSQARRDQNSPEWILQHRRPPGIAVVVTASKQEKDVYPDTRKFLALVRPPMQAYHYYFPRGGHNFATWRPAMVPTVDWVSAEFSKM